MLLKCYRASLIFMIWGSLMLAVSAENTDYRRINEGTEGQKIELSSHLIEGKLNIIDFYSEFCPPCKAIAPALERLAQNDPNVVVGTLDINRPKVRGIDWSSPLAQQYKLRGIPHFKIYDAEGKLVAEGREAKMKVADLLRKNSIR